jgi:hypothetical protein
MPWVMVYFLQCHRNSFRDGLVSEKVTFLDVDTIRTNSLTTDTVQAPK